MRKYIALITVIFLAGCVSPSTTRELNKLMEEANAVINRDQGQAPKETPVEQLPAVIDDLDKDISLGKVVAMALKQNPDLAVCCAKKIDAAVERYKQAILLEDAKASYGVSQVSSSELFTTGGRAMNTIGLSQAIPFPTKLTLRGQMALKDVELEIQNYRAKRSEIVESVKKAYYEYFIANKELEINNENFQLQQENIKIANIKYKVGTSPQQDVIKAQVEASLIYKDVIASEQRIFSAVARLNALLNRSADKGLATPKEPNFKKLEFALPDIEAAALDSRPELKAAEAVVKRREVEEELAKADANLPNFEVGGTYTNTQDPTAPQDSFGVMLSLNLPWLNPRHTSHVTEISYELQVDSATYKNLQNMTSYAVRDAVYKLQAAQQTAELYKTSLLPQAEANVKSARTSYEKDKVDFLTLNDARIKLRDIKLAYYRALADVEVSKAEIERIIGKDIFEGGK